MIHCCHCMSLLLLDPFRLLGFLWMCIFGRVFKKKNLSFKIAMSGRAGVGRHPRFTLWLTFWLNFFQSCMLPLFFSGLLLYLVGLKRRTSRCVTCNRDNSHFVCYVLISPDVRTHQVYLLVNLFSKLYVTFILQQIAFIFGRDEEDVQ